MSEEKSQQMSQQNKIIAAVIAVIIVAGLGYFITQGDTAPDGQPQTVEATEANEASNPATSGIAAQAIADDANDLAASVKAAEQSDAGALDTPNPLGEIMMGQADAPVTIVEYSSLTCPHCGAFHRETLPELKKQYIDTGKVKIKFRPFPFDPYATAGAMLAQCVSPKARVGFLDVLFKRQQQWIQNEEPMEALQALARQAGLSEADFVVCLKDENMLNGIRYMQKAAAEELGVRSTPTFFINGEKLQGNQPLAEFEKRIKPLVN